MSDFLIPNLPNVPSNDEEKDTKRNLDATGDYFENSQFKVGPVPFHTHNGVDSPFLYSSAATSLTQGTNIVVTSATGNITVYTTPAITSIALSYAPNVGSTVTLLCASANEHRVTFPAGTITLAVSGDTNSQKFMVSLTQDSGGSRNVNWFTTIKWAGGSAPTLTTTANKRDTFGFVRTGSGTYDGFIIGQNV